ncbi:MAG: flagellar biosynthetic protein FliR [Rhabdochlamydiaceae bacterium]|jgi:type III secretion protein T
MPLAVVDTTDYVSFILSLPHISPLSALTFFFLTLMRIAPIVALAPFLGSKLPNGVKIGLALSLTTVFLPHVIGTSHLPPPTFDIMFIAYGLKELLMGFILAFLVNIPFYIAQSAGVLIDFQRGSSSLQVFDPLLSTQVSPIGQLYNYVFIVLFYEVGGVFVFLQGVMNSFSAIPVDVFMPAVFFHIKHGFWQFIMVLLTKFTAISIQLAAPSLVAILMTDMFLGIANRLAQQVQIAFLGMSLKSLVGLALLWLGWYFILKQLSVQSQLWLDSIDRIVRSIPVT